MAGEGPEYRGIVPRQAFDDSVTLFPALAQQGCSSAQRMVVDRRANTVPRAVVGEHLLAGRGRRAFGRVRWRRRSQAIATTAVAAPMPSQ